MKRRSFIASIAALFVPTVVNVAREPTNAIILRPSLKELIVQKKNADILAMRGNDNPLFSGQYADWKHGPTFRVDLAAIDAATWNRIEKRIASRDLQFDIVPG